MPRFGGSLEQNEAEAVKSELEIDVLNPEGVTLVSSCFFIGAKLGQPRPLEPRGHVIEHFPKVKNGVNNGG